MGQPPAGKTHSPLKHWHLISLRDFALGSLFTSPGKKAEMAWRGSRPAPLTPLLPPGIVPTKQGQQNSLLTKSF